MGEYFAIEISKDVYDYWKNQAISIPFTRLYIEEEEIDVSNCILFSKAFDKPFCVFRPRYVKFEDWDDKNSFLVKCV